MEEKINHPKHYNQYPIEIIDMMLAIWGSEKTINFCIMNAFKYRMRIGHKNTIEEDLAKENWYLRKAKEIEMLNSTKITEETDVK
jgi:hypothetical protein